MPEPYKLPPINVTEQNKWILDVILEVNQHVLPELTHYDSVAGNGSNSAYIERIRWVRQLGYMFPEAFSRSWNEDGTQSQLLSLSVAKAFVETYWE